MPGHLEKKPDTDFTNTINFFMRNGLILSTLLTIGACEPQVVDNILLVFVEIDINLNNAEYHDLQRDNGYVYILGGVKGIIVYRENSETYLAFERNSPVNPSFACAVVDVDVSGLFISDPCSGAAFDFEGNPINGISPLPLYQYITILDNSWLYIRSEDF